MATAAPTPPRSTGSAVDERPEGRRRAAFAITLAVVVALAVGWAYILFIYDPGLLIDELPDRTFPTQAEEVCAAYRAEISRLPTADLARSATDRADDVETSNVLLTAMVDELDERLELVPAQPPRFREGTAEWLGDWRTYITNREDYVDALRVDPEARFLEDPKGGPSKGITRAIDSFAEVNRMESCTTLGDVS